MESQQIAYAADAIITAALFLLMEMWRSAGARARAEAAQREADLREMMAARGGEMPADDRLKAENLDERGRVRARVYYDATIGR